MKQYQQYPTITELAIKGSDLGKAYNNWLNNNYNQKAPKSNAPMLNIDEFNEWQIEERIRTGGYLEEN